VLDRPTLLDGGMGTSLIARGLLPGALPEEWLLSRPEEIAAVHREHADAGAEVLLTSTFNCAAPRLEVRVDPGRIEELCATAARLARGASRPGGLVAGAVGPTGLHALGAATREELMDRYRRPLAALAAAGVDLLWIESQWHPREALAALEAARTIGLPTVLTFGLPDKAGTFRAPGGGTARDCLSAAAAQGAFAAGVNCVFAGDALAELAGWASVELAIPFVAKPSPGLPGSVLSPERFAAALAPAVARGLRIAGGCCGATGDHLRAVRPLLSPS
jgi:5-methyltetrahydrofolate--homocysteine methyltransferase